jgi:hypothetical protein
MGADRYNERQNMREARQPTRVPPWEIVALDAEGNEFYRTEAFDTEEEARAEAEELNEGGIPERLQKLVDGTIDRFEPVRREK